MKKLIKGLKEVLIMTAADMTLPERAYYGLYKRLPKKRLEVKYSSHFRGYGANVTSTIAKIAFRLSKDFLEVDDEIRIGVMQHLLCRLNKSKKETIEIDLYNKFIKHVGELATGGGGVIADAELQESFDRVNKEYFDNYLLAPNIKWAASHSTSHLGNYSFADDTVTLSKALRGAGEFLDYVLYHELLHKKHKFEHKHGRTRSHTPAFRKDERAFKLSSGKDPEKALYAYLGTIARKRRTRKVKRPGFVQRLLGGF